MTSLFNKNSLLCACVILAIFTLVLCSFAGCKSTGNTSSVDNSDVSSNTSYISSTPPSLNDEVDFGDASSEDATSSDKVEDVSSNNTSSTTVSGNTSSNNDSTSSTITNTSEPSSDKDTMSGWYPWQ